MIGRKAHRRLSAFRSGANQATTVVPIIGHFHLPSRGEAEAARAALVMCEKGSTLSYRMLYFARAFEFSSRPSPGLSGILTIPFSALTGSWNSSSRMGLS